MSHRLDTMPVDLLNASFVVPREFDVVTMIHTIREWSPEHLQRFFHLVYDSLVTGGVLLMDMVARHGVGRGYQKLTVNPDDPGRTALYFLVAASHEEYAHTAADLTRMLTKAGFSYTEGTDGGYVAARK